MNHALLRNYLGVPEITGVRVPEDRCGAQAIAMRPSACAVSTSTRWPPPGKGRAGG